MKKGSHKNTGQILVIVTFVIVAMSVVVVGLMTRNMGRAVMVEDEIKAVEADMIYRGAIDQLNFLRGSIPSVDVPLNVPIPVSINVNGQVRTYTYTYVKTPGALPTDPDRYDITVTAPY